MNGGDWLGSKALKRNGHRKPKERKETLCFLSLAVSFPPNTGLSYALGSLGCLYQRQYGCLSPRFWPLHFPQQQEVVPLAAISLSPEITWDVWVTKVREKNGLVPSEQLVHLQELSATPQTYHAQNNQGRHIFWAFLTHLMDIRWERPHSK